MAAWLGLVPRQYSTGGKARLGRITKRGDVYLRTLLVHGARAALNVLAKRTDRLSTWTQALIARRGYKKAIVALAAKNAILIVEFARQNEEHGEDRFQAAMEAARVRLRPILMTSIAFLLGVVPLMLAKGAGSAARNSLGTAIFGGMLVSTVVNLIFIPGLYVLVQRLRGEARRTREEEEPVAPAPSH